MNNKTEASSRPASVGSAVAPSRRSWLRKFSFVNISVLYVLIVVIIIFSLWAPETFPTWTTARSILNGMAVPGFMALAAILPLSARQFDLSIGASMGFANMLVAFLLVTQGMPVVPAILITLCAGLVMGVINGVVVVNARIDAIIGTLATAALFTSATSIISGQTITGVVMFGDFAKIATTSIGGITLPVILMLLTGLVIWVFQRFTVTGRRIYAIGYNERGAELLGINLKRLKYLALIIGAVVAVIAGIILASTVSSGTPGIGAPYLLNAYAAAFLGSTQFGGKFNVWGTVLAVLMLTTATNGIYLVGGAVWVQGLFSGFVLLFALGASNLERAIQARNWVRRKRSNSGQQAPA